MAIDSPIVQLGQHPYGIMNEGYSEILNAHHVRCELPGRGVGMFAAMKEYFWPSPPSTFTYASHPLANHAIDVENARGCELEQESQHTLTIKRVALVAVATGIAAATYWVHSIFNANGSGDGIEPNLITPDTLSAALVTTALIGRRLLSAPTVTNAITNQSVFANASFNLQVDLNQVFSNTGNLVDIRCSQADGAPLPTWLTMSKIPTTLVGSINITQNIGITSDASVVGNYAYVVGQGIFVVVDICNKTAPVLIGSMIISSAQAVSVVGNYAYLAGYTDGLKIVDVSSKTNPTFVGSVVTRNAVYVTVVGNYAYVADSDGGLKIVDVSSKTNPTFVGSVVTRNAVYVTVVGNYAYVADSDGGLKIVDVSNKACPTITGSIATTYTQGLTVIGNYAYVADGNANAGLKIIDVSSKTDPVLIGNLAGSGYHVTVDGNYAYMATGNGVKIVDVSNKKSPILIGSLEESLGAIGVVISGNYAYITDDYGRLRIFAMTKIVLSGTPASLDRGILPIKLTITDVLGETTSAYFSITVLNHPPIAPTIDPQKVHHAFSWTIPEFSDSDGDALTYSATLADGSPLPGWVSFNATTRNLFGVVPPVVTVRKITIQADDLHGGIANATQTITVVNGPPTAGSSALPSQSVYPTVPFNFTMDPNVFTDPDGDPLTYSAALANQKPLPTWLTFNQTSEIFAGTAPAGSAGLMSVIVMATDPFEAMVSRSFDLNVVGSNNNLPRKLKNPPDYTVGVNKGIAFQISNNTFYAPDNDPLTWSASTAGGKVLPAWLHFEGSSHFFFGTAPDTPQILPIDVQVEDWQHIAATANFNLLVEGAPLVAAPLSNLAANVGTKFKFIIPENTFQNLGIQDAMIYSASLTTGAVLPGWLTFDPVTRTFIGTPGRKDTDLFSSRPLPIRLTASNNIGAASVDFIINVQGESDATLAIKIISGVGATLAITGTVYAKRNSVWKKSMKCVYRLPTEHVVFGQESEYCHTVTRLHPGNVASVKLLRDGKSLPGGVMRPDWLLYDNSTAKLTIDATEVIEQDGLTLSRWTVQVKNKGGCVNHLVWEEFDITFNFNDDPREMASTARMPSSTSCHEQLRQPLIDS